MLACERSPLRQRICIDFAGVLGENVPIPESITKTERSFWMTNGITLCVVIMVFFFLQIYLRWKRLLL